MKLRPARASVAGFSRTDLFATLGILGLMFLCTTVSVFSTGDPLLLPASSRERAKRIVCLANLRELATGYHRWATDHEDRNPMHVDVIEGGIRGHSSAPNVWFQYATLSNELATARILACPSDTNTTRVAENFSSSPNGGLLHPGYRNNAISYFVGLHAFLYEPRSILSADHNVQMPSTATACGPAATSAARSLVAVDTNVRWLENVHGFEGNLLFYDGSAEETTSPQLRAALLRPFPNSASSSTHIFPVK
jgi:prepilin-type processing-associated H-X9-DG protein